MLVSIIIPVFNERSTLPAVLSAVAAALPEAAKEVIVVDDGSTDGTAEWLTARFPEGSGGRASTAACGGAIDPPPAASETGPSHKVVVIHHPRNRGKGAALRTGFSAATGEVIVIQDADLEYDPKDWQRMYDLIAHRQIADVVYGCRFYGSPHRSLYFHHFLANRLISALFNILYNQTLMDIEVCYKMFRREVLDAMHLRCSDFGIEIELSAKIAKARRWRIYEVGISYFGRTYAEGKNINWRDGLKAIWYLLRFRVAS